MIFFKANSEYPDETPRLIWVCALWLCPIYGTLGLNGLIDAQRKTGEPDDEHLRDFFLLFMKLY